jgi:hypothetical protein
MKINIFQRSGLLVAFFLLCTWGCGSSKDTTERRNFMIPKKSEMARNSRYRGVENRKTNKIKRPSSKKKKLF